MSKLLKSKFFRDPQNIIAVSVTIISLCALIVSVIQMNLLREERELMREHARASVWPHLEIHSGKAFDKDGSLKSLNLSLTNSGVGPAIITDVKISYNDTIAHSWWELFDILNIPDSIDTRINNHRFNKRVIKIGETIEILNLDDNLPLANAFIKLSSNKKSISFEIYYKSIYNERWKFANGKTIKLENFEGLPKEEQFY